MNVKIEESWKYRLETEFSSEYFAALADFVRSEYASKTVFPKPGLIFNAFNHCPFEKVKVVILGQDPYHGIGQAHGLCFSVNEGVPFPPSLQNIFKEIASDLGIPIPKSGDLTKWAQQGVFLLNATLTVCENEAGSHQGKGWETFTDRVISILANEKTDLVFMLWGKFAQEKEKLIPKDKHMILKAPHPSPLSAHRGFLGCKHFSQANRYLSEKGLKTIDW
ncbi:MAG: uracil-DNA glycosylase [Cytophagales bacterium]